MSRSLNPAALSVPELVLRVATGFLLSTVVSFLFETRRLRMLPRRIRWPLMVLASMTGLVVSMLLLKAGVIAGPMSVPATFWILTPRLVATGFWCASIFGLEMIEDLYAAEIHLARIEASSIDSELRLVKAEATVRTVELRHLQDQLNPHFLFNALNAVMASKHDPEAVENVTRDLADFLRFMLGDARTYEPLCRELQALEKYLAVQQMRFGDDLTCSITCDQAAHSVLVPPMLIQSLLENALHYGAQTSPMPLKVRVTARVTDGILEVAVANSGRWVPPDEARSPSTGMRSLRKRPALLVGREATVQTTFDDGPDGEMVRVSVRMPTTFAQVPPSAAEAAAV